jgi:hypothetical protein
VGYATGGGTATADVDYAARSGTLSFPAGATTRTISVPTIADGTTEPNETFEVTLTSPTNATIVRARGVATIVDDDVPLLPTLSIDSVSVTEGTGVGTPVASFSVTLSAASSQSVLVSYRTLADSAQSPADFTSTTGTLTFAGGVTAQTIQVPVVPDALAESNETFSVELFNVVRAVVGTGVGTATIVDDDGGGGGGTVTATYVVASGTDDVNEDGGAFTTDGGRVWMGTAGTVGGSYLGLRFTGVTIPAGATVTAARLEVSATTTQWNRVAFEAAAEASTNSAPLTASSRPSQRVLLAPRVTHDSDTQWLAGSTVALGDISALVGAVVQQPGWAAGRPLTLVLRGTAGAWSRKHVASREGGAATAPRLVVTYTTP